MPNLRIVYNNIADKSASLTASNTTGSLTAANMLTEYKGQVHRSTGTSVTYTLTWNTDQSIAAVILPCTNLTTSAQVQVKLYSNTSGTTLVKDSGAVLAVQNNTISTTRWNNVLSANSFAYGGYTKAIVWLDTLTTAARRCDIIITDTSNPAGYIDCSRLVIGSYWSPTYNATNGFKHGIIDTTDISRAQSGDVMVNISPMYETLSFEYALLTNSDRSNLIKLVKQVGYFKNIFLSVLPETAYDNDISIYGRLKDFSYSQRLYSYFDNSVEIEGW